MPEVSPPLTRGLTDNRFFWMDLRFSPPLTRGLTLLWCHSNQSSSLSLAHAGINLSPHTDDGADCTLPRSRGD